MDTTHSETLSPAQTGTRGNFVIKTHLHAIMALAAFVAAEYLLFSSGVAALIAAPLMNNWLLILGGLVLTSWLVSRFSARTRPRSVQYATLIAYVCVEAVIFVPIIMMAVRFGGPGLLAQAAGVTLGLAVFSGIAVYAFRANFSFLAPFLAVFGIAALALIVASLLFGFSLGMLFTYAMVTYALGAILYEMSTIQRAYEPDEYVAASLALVASIFLLLWYVIQMIIPTND